jgi:hypothetical protein
VAVEIVLSTVRVVDLRAGASNDAEYRDLFMENTNRP